MIFLNILLTLLFLTHSLQAREITWSEAIKLAQQNSLEYQAALSTYKSVEELELSGAGAFLPKLTASASGTQSGTIGSTGVTNNYSAQLSLSQNLFSGFSDINNYFLKKTNSKLALATLNSAKAKLSQELKQSYAELFYMQDFKKLAHDILKRRIENNNNVRLQYEVGRENKGSLLLAKSYVDSAEYDILKSEHDLEMASENLKRILGVSRDETLTIANNIAKEQMSVARPDFNYIASQHPDVLSAQHEESLAAYNLKITRAQFLPSLDFSGNYIYTDTKFFPENDKWNVALTLSIPLFEGFKTYSSYNSNSAKLDSSKLNSVNIFKKLESAVKKSYYDYVESIQKEKIDENFNKAALLRAEIARNKYKNGFLSFEEWDSIETDLILKQKEILGSEKNRIIKQALWEQAQGVGVF